MTTSKYDMAYGRQGGRIVAWTANATEPPRCTNCAALLLTSDTDLCTSCAPQAPDSLFEITP